MTGISSGRLVRPRRLKAGDVVAVVSPSWGGPGAFPGRYAAGKRQLEAVFGLRVVEMEHALKAPEWVQANPAARARDIMAAFADPGIDGVIASIGGEDAVRLIPYLDLAVLRANPKVFLGFSDTTALHLACWQAGLGSFYGPSIMAGIAENGGMHGYTVDGLRKALFETAPIGVIKNNPEGWTVERTDWGDAASQGRKRQLQAATPHRLLQGQGRATGHLMGGCAEVLEMLKGSAWWPPLEAWTGAILFYETSEDAPRIGNVRYWLRNYAACGILGRLNGIVLARPDPGENADYQEQLEGAVIEMLAEAGLNRLPVLSRLDFGHTQPMVTLPYGAMAEIDCDEARLAIAEPAVC